MTDLDEPNMSDTTLLVSVEDLINMAMGPSEKNVVNFKLIQTVLHILARNMRMLEQRVEIRITDEQKKEPRKGAVQEARKSRSPEKEGAKERSAKREIEKAERAALKEKEKEERAASKDRDRADRAVSMEREKAEKVEAKERKKEEKAAAKDKEKAAIAEYRESEKAEREAAKERERAERAASKEREKEERAASKEREKAERASSKEREKAEKAADKEREKAEKAAEKDKDKAEGASSKEREKAEKAAAKEREKAEKAAEKDKDKAERASSKEREKAEKAAEKEKEKAGKATEKDKDKAERASSKEREKPDKAAEKVQEKAAEKGDKAASKDKEKPAAKGKEKEDKAKVERRKEKVLVVEKGPTTRASESRRGSIEVVTRSQFDIVQNMVKELQQRAGPLPPPALPDNKKLMKDLAKGNASLNDTMQAMQVTARVRAAEKAIGRMGEMLTALAAAGALPADFVMEDIKFEPPEVGSDTTILVKYSPEKGTTRDGRDRKSVAIDPTTMPSEMSQTDDASLTSTGAAGAAGAGAAGAAGRPSVATATSRMSTATSGGLGRPSIASRASVLSGVAGVTHPEMDSAIRDLRDELTKTVQLMTTKATIVAETASASAKAVAEKLEIALKLDTRISTLNSLVSDYAEQLSGFDSGLTTQMSSFRDQLTQMQAELGAGLKQLEVVNNNAETAAVMELTERYEGLVADLDQTMNTHRALTTFQSQLGVELHSLVECVEMLREQKADRDEVLDGLRDKADNSRLAGLLTVAEFNMARQELEKRLDVCHDKFRRQENVWMTALKDLKHVTQTKAEIMQLLAARERAEQMLLELQERQERLAVILGEPKAAMLTRALARGAVCGSCMTPALMEPQDESYGAPPALPAVRPRPVGADDDEPCMPEWKPPEPPDNREHTCHRWCGGSHTLLSEAVTRERAPPVQLQEAPTKRYTGYGDDGRLYMLEEELQPCVECNKFPGQPPDEPAPAPPADGAGDQGPPPETI
ncbi:hypothetical protein ABMA28_004230 [Loxostege sticticalis]|uniref:DUF4795 domain-containing protein n=1 Tax=Loxostege sticticalis TaxID=481309 RepID=A0ABD0SUQ2_LOXSC